MAQTGAASCRETMDDRGLERWAGGLACVAGLVHGGLGPSHFEEWWGYGAFFIVASLAQIILGLALLLDPFDPAQIQDPRRAKRLLHLAGVGGQVLLIVVYVVTRTVGIPFLGPEAGVVEEVAPLDILTKGVEAACVGVLLALLSRNVHAAR